MGEAGNSQVRLKQKQVHSMEHIDACWDEYFEESRDVAQAETALVEMLVQSLDEKYDLTPIVHGRSLTVEYSGLVENVTDKFFPDLLHASPTIAFDCLECAIHVLALKKHGEFPSTRITVRVFGYPKLSKLSNLRSNMIGFYVSIRGTIIRTGNIKPLLVKVNYVCAYCGAVVTKNVKNGQLPTEVFPCLSCKTGIRHSPLELDRTTPVMSEYQIIRLQEEVEESSSGNIPRTIECELRGDSVGVCAPGDHVTLVGVLMKSPSIDRYSYNDRKTQQTLYDVFVAVNSVSSVKHDDHSPMQMQTQTNGHVQDFGEQDLRAVQRVHEQRNLVGLLAHSVGRGIYGHEIVKAGLCLCLFGGCQKYGDITTDINKHTNDMNSHTQSKLALRGDVHMLIVGDPGLGKSQLLRRTADASPRGVFVSGTGSSATGLTVSVHRDSGTSDFSLEAGALVLADQGCCCIDEFDKMRTQEHQALLEAMEQQSISIAKAGIVSRLPAHTAVVCAANPAGGKYNFTRTIAENLKMSPALLSRFDLLFVLIDKPDIDADKLLSSRLLDLHSTADTIKTNNTVQPKSGNQSLLERLKQTDRTPLPLPILRRYISYAKKYCQPRLTRGACDVIHKYYLELRATRGEDTLPVTNRQLESLIRLTEARAKIELRNDACQSDAEDAVFVFKYCLNQRQEAAGYSGENAAFAFVDLRTSGRMSRTKVCARFASVLTQKAKEKNTSLFERDELRDFAQRAHLLSPETMTIDTLLNLLSEQGYLLLAGGGRYRLTTVPAGLAK